MPDVQLAKAVPGDQPLAPIRQKPERCQGVDSRRANGLQAAKADARRPVPAILHGATRQLGVGVVAWHLIGGEPEGFRQEAALRGPNDGGVGEGAARQGGDGPARKAIASALKHQHPGAELIALRTARKVEVPSLGRLGGTKPRIGVLQQHSATIAGVVSVTAQGARRQHAQPAIDREVGSSLPDRLHPWRQRELTPDSALDKAHPAEARSKAIPDA